MRKKEHSHDFDCPESLCDVLIFSLEEMRKRLEIVYIPFDGNPDMAKHIKSWLMDS